MKKIRKIVLINPLYDQSHRTPKFLLFEPDWARRVESSAPNYKYILIDENVENNIDFNLVRSADLIGISSMTSQAQRAYRLADTFRKMGIPVVMGGIHGSALSKEGIKHADAVVVGEAEGVWPRVIKDIEKGQSKKIYKAEEWLDLSELPPLKMELLNQKLYNFNCTWTTRGCPFNCSFCSVSRFFGKKFRTRPIKQVIEEIKRMKEKAKTDIRWKLLGKLLGKTPKIPFAFLDDNIIGRVDYARELFRVLIPLNIIWGSQTSINLATPKNEELLRLAAESGCKILFVGFESVDKSSLDEIGKKVNKPDMYKKATEIFHKYGILVMGAFIFGFDHDDKNSFKRTVEFAEKIKLDFAQFTILTPLPGTRLMDELKESGRITSWDWSNYDLGHVVFEPKGMSSEELAKGHKWAWKRFYSFNSMLKRSPSFSSDWLGFIMYWLGNLGYWRYVTKRTSRY